MSCILTLTDLELLQRKHAREATTTERNRICVLMGRCAVVYVFSPTGFFQQAVMNQNSASQQVTKLSVCASFRRFVTCIGAVVQAASAHQRRRGSGSESLFRCLSLTFNDLLDVCS